MIDRREEMTGWDGWALRGAGLSPSIAAYIIGNYNILYLDIKI
jgi:hypothetical protein